jgi:hypothetical protein
MRAISDLRCAGRGAILLATLVLLLASPRAAALADTCGQAISPPVVSVRTLVRPASYDFSRGIRDLSGDLNLAVPHGMSDFKYAVGATAVVAERESRWEMRGEQTPDGRQCWWITSLQITVTAHTKVYVAKEVPKDSCVWQEVMRHEAKHVKIDQKLFPRLVDTLRPKVVRQISKSVPARNQAEAEATMNKLVNNAADAAIQAFQKKRNRSQLAIDTRDEYTRSNRLCGEAAVADIFARAGLE